MALIGTISGSNGTTTSAVTGSMIIAENPGVITPVRPESVVLYVSGAATSIGADDPSILLKGDAFISGALGTDSYFQMKPVNTLRIPTNTTASYIYTSGSTNDLYFTQYFDPYTNTTRLRWLESQLQTGILHGGLLSSTSGSTTYNISSGSGIIVSPNASLSDDPYPTIRLVDWGDLTGLPLPSISTTQITYIGMDSTGTPYLKSAPFINGDYAQYISLGRVLHTDKVGTNGAVNQQSVSYGTNQFRGDFVRAFGPIKLSGHTLYVSGTTGLKKDAGDSYAEGRNYTVDPDSPNYISSTTDTAQDTSKIFYEYVNASGDDVILNNGNLGYSAVDFAQYNNAGTLATVGTGNKFTIQRVFWFPNSANRAFFVYYGNVIYSTIADAQAGISTEVFTEGKNTRDSAIFLGYVIVKGTLVDFTDPTTYKVVQAGSFRAVASSGAGASGAPGGADTYVQFNDAGVFNGTSDFRFVKSTGTVSMANLIVTGTSAGSLVSSGTLQVKSGAGAVVGSISTGGVISGSSDLQIGGNITGSNAVLVGDLALNGGDLTSTASTLNLATSIASQLNVGGTTPIIEIGTSGGSSSTRLAYGQTASPAVKTVEIGTRGNSGSTTNVTIGSATAGALGRITLSHDVALSTGNIIGAPGSGANVMTLISSGNIIAKLDTDASADGHKFIVHDHRNIEQFSVGENGNAELSGSLFVTGSITTSGTLRSDNSIGDEGGEIFLNRSVTNTVLTGGLTIDMYQNRLRFFEQGGTNRGFFVDISEGGTSVSKNLVFTGSTNTFTSTVGSPFTLPIPPECGIVEIETCGGGGGGGSGGKLPSGNPSFGGGGGGGGGYSFISLRASTARALSSNLTITIGASGSGGLAITVDGTTGSAGTAGLATTVAAGATVLLFAPGGPGGAGGTTTTGTGGTAVSWKDAGGTGANSSASAKPNRPLIAGFAGGGAAGGGVDGAGTARDGGDGGTGGDVRVDGVNRAGNGGTAAARNGVDATTSAAYSPTGGGGGGGGAARNGGGVAGTGGRGIQGSGGGGGGGNINGVGNNSGAGANGGEGWCIVRFI